MTKYRFKNIICDWNGTLFTPDSDRGLHSKLIKSIIRRNALNLEFLRLFQNLISLPKLFYYVRSFQNKKITYSCLYQYFNDAFIKGELEKNINADLTKYQLDNLNLLDKETLNLLVDFKMHGGNFNILSYSYDYIIEKTLQLSNFRGLISENTVYAQKLETENCLAKKFSMNVYGKKKLIFENHFIKQLHYNPNETLYIGDSRDDTPIAELLPEGQFVVSCFASTEFKIFMRDKYNAFIPKNVLDLEGFITNNQYRKPKLS